MARHTIEVITDTDAGSVLESIADEFGDARLLDSTTIVRLDGALTVSGAIPEHVDPNGLLIRFALDGKYLTRVWMDVHWVPRVGEAIRLERLDAGEGAAMIKCVMWEESNLATIVIEPIDMDNADG